MTPGEVESQQLVTGAHPPIELSEVRRDLERIPGSCRQEGAEADASSEGDPLDTELECPSRVVAHVRPGHVEESPGHDRVEPLGFGQGATRLHRPESLVRPAIDADESALRDQDVGDIGDVVEALRASKGTVRERDCPDSVLLEPIRASQLMLDLDQAGVVTEVL